MLDVYLHGDVDRISPEAPVPVVRVRERRHALGGAGNVAQNVRAVGADCHLVAAIGDDLGGTRLRSMLEEIDASVESLVTVDRPTTTKTRIVARSQQVVRVDEEEDADLDGGEVERLLGAVAALSTSADALVLEDYNKGVLVPRVISIGDRRPRGPRAFRSSSIRSTATSFSIAARRSSSRIAASSKRRSARPWTSSTRRRSRRRSSDLAWRTCCSRSASAGWCSISSDGEIMHVPTAAREVYDVVGAGDTVTAYLAVILAAGGSPAEAAVDRELRRGRRSRKARRRDRLAAGSARCIRRARRPKQSTPERADLRGQAYFPIYAVRARSSVG